MFARLEWYDRIVREAVVTELTGSHVPMIVDLWVTGLPDS